MTETLTCFKCYAEWTRDLRRGPKPKLCPWCADGPGPKSERNPERDRRLVLLRTTTGMTLEAIGELYGLSRERVRQITDREAPWKPWEAVKTERRVVTDEATANYCRVCGVRNEQRRYVYCSEEHARWRTILRFITSDEDRETHRMAIARWQTRHFGPDTVQGRWARRALRGEDTRRGRWFTEGSEVHAIALECVRNNWPIVREFHPDLLRQLEQEMGHV